MTMPPAPAAKVHPPSGAAPGMTPAARATLTLAAEQKSQILARLAGGLFLVTFVTSIPALLLCYAHALGDPGFILGGGFDRGVSTGALLELFLIAANVGTALVLYPVLRKHSEVLSLGYVAARLTENGFIAVGIVALMALNTLRLHASGADPAMLLAAGQTLVAVHDWTFRIGPGVIVGIGNGLILGTLMWKTRLVPRAMSILGLIGGPAVLMAGIAVLFGTIEAGSAVQAISTVPEFLWELSLGIWLLVKGFDRTALTELNQT
ncbi:DUF4386 domain-containing protein [Tabrizicola sp. BL-A-41-H6]|uniref:DUF4386 domain-containing protein n=1 Tax=Tabrizicola sp. BL-A-41-H6 TaxID=3421107 RepID=UPI003D6694E6